MHFTTGTGIFMLIALSFTASARENYTAPSSGTTIMDYLNSDPDLSSLAAAMKLPLGFETAFSHTPETNNFTFFAPNNAAFASMSQNLKRFYLTPSTRGRAYLGNTLMYHYLPVDVYKTDGGVLFTDTFSRVQTATFLFLGTQKVGKDLVLNRRVKVVKGDIPVAGGVIHIVDGILDPTGMFFDDEYAVPKVKQTFMAGWELPY
ncbi:FAS1 domain-containing protein [Morchella snyderi]|nr:FAS1 domain-containing protein [Morchella snyderi]